MGIKCNTPQSELNAYFTACKNIVDTQITRTLSRLGEEAVIIARDRPMSESWIDHTGNLRSSVGYAIYENKNDVVEGGFLPTSAPEGNGSEGQSVGREFASHQSGEIGDASHTLVIVAGMNYAAKVEAMENKDVLATAELKTRAKLPEYIRRTKTLIDSLIARL